MGIAGRRARHLFWLIPLIAVVAVGVSARMGLFAGKPPELGPQGGRLLVCPDKRNCVCSIDDRPTYFITPFRYGETDGTSALRRLTDAALTLPRVSVVEERPDEGYVRLEAKSALLGFVDDVELLLDATNQQIHVRSASRLGEYDFGVNRRRVEDLRRRFPQDAP